MVVKSTIPLLALVPYASAWGSLGHTTVAYIAQNFVCDKTAKYVQRVLNDTSANYMANIAVWADSYRKEPGGEFSGVLHYIDALDNPPESCGVIYERDCPEEGCIISALANYSSRAVEPSVGFEEQQKAMKWVIHFTGDVHQPLHVENIAIGGNTINVTFDGVKTNLHAAWDTNIPQKAIGNFSLATAENWAKTLTTQIKSGQYKKESRTWLQGINVKDTIATTMHWAIESNAYVCSTVLPNGDAAVNNQEIGGAYYETAIPVVQKQIARAGYRLAAWLDAIVEAADKHHGPTPPHGPPGHGPGPKPGPPSPPGKPGPGDAPKPPKTKREWAFEPWQQEAREKRRAFGGDCGCTAEAHGH